MYITNIICGLCVICNITSYSMYNNIMYNPYIIHIMYTCVIEYTHERLMKEMTYTVV